MKKLRFNSFTALVSVLVLGLPIGFLWAQEKQKNQESEPQTDGVYAETVDVNVVNVEVYVTDKKGNRIDGLKRGDFTLEVDDRPITITNFYAVEGGKVQSTVPGAVETVEIPANPSPTEVAEIPVDQRLHLVIYVDNLNLHPFTRNRVLRNIRTFLHSRLRRGDEVMLVTYERSLHTRHPFTSDPDVIASTLFELEELSAMAVHTDSDRKDMLEMVYEAEDIYQVRGRASQHAESRFSDLSFTIDALKGLVETLAGLPGRKAILYVSDGLEMRAGEDIFHAIHDRFPNEGSILMETQRYDLSRRFQSLTNQANANRVTFYTLEAAGLRVYSYLEASNATPGGGSRIDQVHFSNLQSSLRFMAEQTGGMAMLNTNNYTPMLDRMADDFGTYYSLGFVSGQAESGRYQDVKVKVKGRKGLRVRHREGFRDKPVSARMTDGTLASLHYGYQDDSIGVELVVGDMERQQNGHYVVPILVKIPIGELAFLPQAEMQRGRVRLFVGAKDEEGGLAPVQDVQVPIDIPTTEFEQAKKQFYQYEMKLIMRTGRQVVAVGVRDEIGAEAGFVTRGLRVGA